MKKKNLWKKAADISLCVVLCAGMTACGSQTASEGGSASSAGAGSAASSEGGSSSSSGNAGTGTADQVIIYSNADDEAVDCIEKTLDDNGYSGQYVIQTFGTSELGGKLLSEGSDIEADLITMSSYYVDSAQTKFNMFKKLSFTPDIVDDFGTFGDYLAPFLANQGAILVNTDELEKEGLSEPKSIKDLADPVYKGHISTIDIEGSSTAWLMVQALVASYGEDETVDILSKIYDNAGENIEQSGSGPLKKLRAGEVAVGFGLRHQAVADKKEGLPIDYVDPTEGNYTLTESLAVVDHGTAGTDKAMEMLRCIIEKGRPALMEYYPIALYKNETPDENAISENSKVFPEPLTVDLLQKHIELSKKAKTEIGL